ISPLFIIDNAPDVPRPTIISPENWAEVDGEVNIYAEVTDDEDNIHSVDFSYENTSGNWVPINNTEHWSGKILYMTTWNTNPLPNGTYRIRVVAEDRNKYNNEDYIRVIVSHG
ncbi:MAG: hypothetical protein JSW28_03655, partial [Thermoplasmata archaeon]